MFYDIGSLTLLNLSPTQALTATANGAGVDMKDFVGTVAVILDSAAGTGTTPANTTKIQDSDDNSTFADVAGAAFAQVTNAGVSQQRIGLNVDSVRRYIRTVDTISGTTPSFTRSVNVLGRKQVFP
jgi:hypothetical protein